MLEFLRWRLFLIAVVVMVTAAVLVNVGLASGSGLTVEFTCSPSCQVTTGTKVTFTATSNAQKPVYGWDLNNDGVYGDQAGPKATLRFTKPGIYPISVRVVDSSDQQSTSATHDVKVAPLQADFSCAPSCTVPAGTTVTFTATSNAVNPSYSWDMTGNKAFGDEAGAKVKKRFVPDGTLTISLRATDRASGGSVVVSHKLDVKPDTSKVTPKLRMLQVGLFLLDSPLGRVMIGPEHGQPLAPTGPTVVPKLPRHDPLPHMKMQVPRRPVRVGRVVRLSLGLQARKPIIDVAWDLDGDGLRNDAYGRSVAYPVTCPGANTFRAEVVDGFGIHVGDRATVRGIGSVLSAKKLHSAMLHARLVRRSPRLGARYGAWRHLGAAFGSSTQKKATVPIERTLRTIGSVGGNYANVAEPMDSGHQPWASSWRAARGVKNLTPDAAGETATGTLISPRFVLHDRYVTFYIGGRNASCHGHSAETATLYIQRGHRFVPVHGGTVTPGDQEQMHPVAMRIAKSLTGATAILVVGDNSADGHVNVGRLVQTRVLPDVFRYPPSVIGWADTHEHLDAHQGFGGLNGVRTYMGVPGSSYANYQPVFSSSASPAQRLSAARAYEQDVRDAPTHFAGPLGAVLLSLIHGVMHATLDGVSLTQDIPAGLGSMFNAFHEQFQVIELHRAWEGGMRLISSLAINNHALEYLLGQPDSSERVPQAPDRETIEAHVEAMRQLAADNSDWMQIVYSPTEARDAIAHDKLAVVLGTEVDQLGSLGFNSPQQEVDWLWQIGIRQVTPIHSINNAIGGAAIFQDVYDMTNDLVNRHNPAGNSTTQSTTTEIARGVQDHGIEARADTLAGNSSASYGYFFHTTRSNQCVLHPSRPQPDCVSYGLNALQMEAGVHPPLNAYGLTFTNQPTPLVVGINSTITSDGGPPSIFNPTLGDLFNLPLTDILDTEHPNPSPPTGGTNVEGLTARGKEYIDALEHHGMLVDIEHMSDASIQDLLKTEPDGTPQEGRSPAWQFAPHGCNYVLNGQPYYVPSAPCMQYAYPYMSSHTSFRNQSLTGSQTRTKDYLRREFERTDAQIDYIDRAGGTIAPVVLQDPDNTTDPAQPGRRSSVTDPQAPGLNDCAGSSKSWVAAYLWAINHTTNHHIALATDMAVVGGTGARIWDHSTNPILPNNCPASSGSALDGLQLDLGYLSHPENIAPDMRQAERFEENRDPSQYNHDQGNPLTYTENPITGGALRPDQPPVVTPGGVSFGDRNFNTQGMLTIGQLPDMLQDTINDGMSDQDLSYLMNSSQYYIDMWDKAYRLNGCLDRYDQPTGLDDGRCQGPNPSAVDLSASSICRNTCPNNPGDGSSLDPNGHRFNYTSS